MAKAKKKVTTTTTTVVVTEEVVSQPSVTRVALVIDRSGSMSSVRTETKNGINAQLATLKKNAKKGGKTYVTYVQFDGEIETVFENQPAEKLKPITDAQYVPRGWTALYDATLRAIQTLPQAGDPSDAAYLVVVVTDGADNSSRETNQFKLGQLIKEYEAKGNWTFTYLLSNLDAKTFAQGLNIQWNNVSTYTSTAAGTAKGFATTANAIDSYMTLRSSGLTNTSNFYNSTTSTPAVDTNTASTPADPDKK